MACYLRVRRDWLANHPNTLLRRSVYRMDALKGLIDTDNWDLGLPFRVRGQLIDNQVLAGAPVRASAAVAEERLLRLRTPFMRGQDVAVLQQALAARDIVVDFAGVFGRDTEAAVVAFQEREGLGRDGMVGPSTRSRLDIDL